MCGHLHRPHVSFLPGKQQPIFYFWMVLAHPAPTTRSGVERQLVQCLQTHMATFSDFSDMSFFRIWSPLGVDAIRRNTHSKLSFCLTHCVFLFGRSCCVIVHYLHLLTTRQLVLRGSLLVLIPRLLGTSYTTVLPWKRILTLDHFLLVFLLTRTEMIPLVDDSVCC